MRKLCLILFLVLFTFSSIFANGTDEKSSGTIKIMRSYYAEQVLDAEIFKQMVENSTNYKVDVIISSGGSPITIASLKAGDVDIVPTQTSTLYNSIFGNEWVPGMTDDIVWTEIQKDAKEAGFNVTTLNGVNFPWIIVINKNFAEANGIKTCADLIKVPGFTMAVAPGGLDRQDGLGAHDFVKFYNLKPGEVTLLSENVGYEAVNNGTMDVVIAGLAATRYPNNIRLSEDFYPQFYNCYAWKGLPEVVLAELYKLENAFTTEDYMSLIEKLDDSDLTDLVKAFLTEKNLLN